MSEENNEKKSKFEQVMIRLDNFTKKFARSKFAEVTTIEDSVLVYEGELEVGTAMFIRIEEDEVVLPEGSYELSGDMAGTVITVDVDGIIVEIIEAPEEVITPEEEPEEVITPEEMSKQLQDQKEELIKKFNIEIEELKELTRDMGEQLKKFSEEASEVPAKKKFERTTSKNSGLTEKGRAIMLSVNK